MDSKKFEILMPAVNLGSFSKASEVVGYTQSGLTHMMNSLEREIGFLTVHSMLHLLGYDHENGGLEAMRMREKEEAVLIQLGLPRTVSYTE